MSNKATRPNPYRFALGIGHWRRRWQIPLVENVSPPARLLTSAFTTAKRDRAVRMSIEDSSLSAALPYHQILSASYQRGAANTVPVFTFRARFHTVLVHRGSSTVPLTFVFAEDTRYSFAVLGENMTPRLAVLRSASPFLHNAFKVVRDSFNV